MTATQKSNLVRLIIVAALMAIALWVLPGKIFTGVFVLIWANNIEKRLERI